MYKILPNEFQFCFEKIYKRSDFVVKNFSGWFSLHLLHSLFKETIFKIRINNHYIWLTF